MSSAGGATVNIVDTEGKPIEATEHGEMKTSILSIVMYDQVEGNALNTNIWTSSVSGMTIVQSGGFINLNAAAAVTANAYAILTSNKIVPFYGEQEVELSTSCKLSVLPDSNCVVEIGYGLAATNATPTDGAFMRITAGGVSIVSNFGGVETVLAHTAVPVIGVVQDYDVLVDATNIECELDGVKVNLDVPVGNPFPCSIARQPVFYRVYNKSS